MLTYDQLCQQCDIIDYKSIYIFKNNYFNEMYISYYYISLKNFDSK